MGTSTEASAARSVGRRRQQRAIAVVAGAVAALAVWLVASLMFSVDLVTTASPGSEELTTVGFVDVLMSSAGAGLVGWAVLALLERFTDRARTIWLWLAVAFVVVSTGGPFMAAESGGTMVTLLLMHLAVAGTVIPLMRRS